MIEDEFTIPRPRWIVPIAMLGALLLFLGIVVGSIVSSSQHTPPVRFTGTTLAGTGATATASTTTVP